jgi:uncharacterized membrane protein
MGAGDVTARHGYRSVLGLFINTVIALILMVPLSRRSYDSAPNQKQKH